MRASAALRSFLFVAGNQEARFAKASASGADAVVFDLEDTVPPAEKDAARCAVAGALTLARTCKAYVRVNTMASGLVAADLQATAGPGLDGVVLPKVESVADVRGLAAMLENAERERGLGAGSLDFIALIESALALQRLEEIAGASARLTRLAFGAADYVHDLNLQWTVEEGELAHARARLVHASRTAGLEAPLDAVLLEINDTDRFLAAAKRARSMGFLGKLCIHPAQIAPCHAAFTPTAAEVEHARRVIEAFEKAEAAGSAALQLDGYFIDYAIVRKARRVLALARR